MLQRIRREQQFKYYFFEKYKKLLEFDKKKLAIYRIIHFARKYILFEPENITKEQVESISGFYRIRLKLEINEKKNNKELNELISAGIIDDKEDEHTMKAIMESIGLKDTDIYNYSKKIINVCLNLNMYGPNPHEPIFVNGNKYFLNDRQICKLTKLWDMLNPSKMSCQRYMQDRKYEKVIAHELKIMKK